MDSGQFDSFTRSLITAGSRRRALATAFAGSLGLLGLTQPNDTEAGGKCKFACGECGFCRKGKCKKTNNGKKKCKAGKCFALSAGTPCTGGSCSGSGVCVATPPPPPPTCSFVGLRAVCTSQAQCCTGSTGAICGSNFCRPDNLAVCCKPEGGLCTIECDCCGANTFCIGGTCRVA